MVECLGRSAHCGARASFPPQLSHYCEVPTTKACSGPGGLLGERRKLGREKEGKWGGGQNLGLDRGLALAGCSVRILYYFFILREQCGAHRPTRMQKRGLMDFDGDDG